MVRNTADQQKFRQRGRSAPAAMPSGCYPIATFPLLGAVFFGVKAL
jgi:hypothetical protein